MDYTLELQPQFAKSIKPKQDRIKSLKKDCFRRIFVEVKNGNTVRKDNFQPRGGQEIQKELSTIVVPEDKKQSLRIQNL